MPRFMLATALSRTLSLPLSLSLPHSLFLSLSAAAETAAAAVAPRQKVGKVRLIALGKTFELIMRRFGWQVNKLIKAQTC